MSSKNEGDEPKLKAITSIESFGWRTFEIVSALFTKLWTPVQLLLAAAGLVLAVYYGNELRRSLLNAQRGVELALAAKVEPSRSAQQGITAILLSDVKDEWSNPALLNPAELNPILRDFENKVQDMSKAYGAGPERADQKQAEGASPGKETLPAPPAIPELISMLNLKVENTGSTAPWQTAITSKRKESYGVVPATSFRRRSLNEPPLEPKDQASLAAALEHNPEIRFDLHLAAELEPIMRRLDAASGEKLTVIQTYFITEAGVFLIRAAGVKDHSKYYGRDFLPYNQYMDRPYFWGAVDLRQRKLTPFDYGTKPYLDLGGNGFVVTFSKKFDLPNQRVGVLCVDAKLPDYVTDEIQEHLGSMGASVSDFYWSESKGIEPGKRGPLPAEFSWFDVQLNKSRESRSDVLGSITTEPAKVSPSQSNHEGGSVVRFTVPVVSSEYGEGNRKTRLLWVEFDSARILKRLTKNLVFFTAGIILVIAVTWILFWDYTILKREMSKVLKKLSKVMQDASTPFVWLNERNEFEGVNKRMLDVLEYENIEELRMHSPTFRGLITAQTQETYDLVLANSAAGQETGEYEIDVVTKTGKVLHVRAHGERIPYPTLWRRGIPHRFGIFVEVIESASVGERKSARARHTSSKELGVRP